MNNLLIILGLFILLPLLGCNQALKRAVTDMEASKQAYKNCLEQNYEDTTRCDTLREIFEVDVEAYKIINDELY